jgi:hypothetical protein
MSFFDFLNAINTTKEDLLKKDPLSEKEYVSFMINRSLSYFPDTVLFANEMNRHSSVPKDWQFAFYRNGVSKKNRFSKWQKKTQNSDDLKLVMKEYNYSAEKAEVALGLITADQLKIIRQKYSIGGR